MPVGAIRRIGLAIALSLQGPTFSAVSAGVGFLGLPSPGNNNGDEPPPDPGGALRGVVVDEQGKPIEDVVVELLPVDKREAAIHPSDFTNERGEYLVDGITPARYVVSIHARRSPSGTVPFLGVYHPGVDSESIAEPITIEPQQTVELPTARLRRVPTARVIVNVLFEDGARPEWSNLLVDNPQFPQGGLVGGHADGMSDGRGLFTLPTGYEYFVQAMVHCLVNDRIEFRESRLIQQLVLFDSKTPAEWTFVIPGDRCTLWTPSPR